MPLKRLIAILLLCASVSYAALGDKTVIGPTDGLVPKTTKVNGKALAGDIVLNSADVGAVSSSVFNSYSTSNQQKLNNKLGITDQASDSNKLNGQLASYYQTALGYIPMKTDYSNAGTAPVWNQNTTGSSATLTTARTINGVSFNGSANIQTATANTSDYSSAAWTPTDTSGAGLTLTSSGTCTKIGNFVSCAGSVVFPATADTSWVSIGNLANYVGASALGGGVSVYNDKGFQIFSRPAGGWSTSIIFVKSDNTPVTNVMLSGGTIVFTHSYYQ